MATNRGDNEQSNTKATAADTSRRPRISAGFQDRTGSQTISRTGSQTISRTGSQTISRTGSQTISRTGSQTISRTGSQTISRTGSQTISRTGSQTISRTGSQTLTRAAFSKAARAACQHLRDSKQNYSKAYELASLMVENWWRLGLELDKMDLHPGQPEKNSPQGDHTLGSLGINKNQSARCQKLAEMSKDELDEWLESKYDEMSYYLPSLRPCGNRWLPQPSAYRTVRCGTKINTALCYLNRDVAIENYLKAADESLFNQNQASSIKLRAERKAGGMIADLPKAPGKRTDKPRDTMSPGSKIEVLHEVGLGKKHGQRLEMISTIPDSAFEVLVDAEAATDAGREITQHTALRAAKKAKEAAVHQAGTNNAAIHFAIPIRMTRSARFSKPR